MRLNKILNALDIKTELPNINIVLCTRNLNDIELNSIFFSFDDINKKSFESARKKGAYLIIGEGEYLNNHYIRVDSIKKVYQKYLLFINKNKLKKHTFIGVTGTAGKTSVSTMLYQFLQNHESVIYYGSNGIYKNSKHYPCNNTTPSMEEFFRFLGHEKYVIIEISSISFFEYRLFGISFDYIILTNIFEDHLDYHQTIDSYRYTKYLILNSNFKATAFVCDDVKDRNVLRLNHNTYFYGFSNSIFKVTEVTYNKENTIFSIEYNGMIYKMSTNLLGVYNLKNICAVLMLLLYMGYEIDSIVKYYNSKITIPGRLNIYYYHNKPIIIDFPHTEASYKAILETYFKLYGKNLIVIYGAGGNRQVSKRSSYSRLVSNYGGYAILTNDNPREENEMQIIGDLALNLEIPYEIIPDRVSAIKRGLEMIDEFSAMLILGKGAEEYMIIKNNKIPYSDINTLKELIK